MNPASADRGDEATLGIAPATPAACDVTLPMALDAAQPASPVPTADTTKLLPSGEDPGATANFVPPAPLPTPQKQPAGVGNTSSSGLRFKILRPHAKGGLGQVLVAEDLELHREVALKEILKRHAGDPDSQSRFVLEAEITGGLEHPGIVPVYGLGTYPDGRPFYAMRFIRGESLAATIERFHETAAERDAGQSAVELRQLLGRFIAVCNAIEYAHSRGILHRDIKPANIMLGKYGETLVVDWGIAKLMSQPETATLVEEGTLRPVSANDTTATQMGSTMGTPQYMSPEQAAGRLDLLCPGSDVYSLGATLYYLLAGVPAFDGTRIMEMLKNVERGEFLPPREWNKSIPKPLNAICLKAMALEPADRYASARALSDDVEHWLADEPVTAYQESVVERARRWLRHHRSWAQASLITLLAVTGVSIVATVLVNQARNKEVLAKEKEVVARKESERQRQLADASFLHARGAVEEFFTRVSESTLLDVPGMQPLRHELLEVALLYEQTFLEQRGNDPTLRREAAAAMFRVALVTAEIKSTAEALPLFERARKMQEELLTGDADSALRYALSNTYNEMGRAHLLAGRVDEAQQWFQKSLDLREKLVQDEAANTEYQRKLANTYNNVGVIAKVSGRLDDALKDYRRANELRERLVALDANKPLFRRDLARGRYNLGLLAREAQDIAQAEAELRQAAAVYAELMAQYPLVTQYRQELGTCYRVLGDVLIQTNQDDAALAAYNQAREIQQRLASENPHLVELAADLAATYSNLAGLHERLYQTNESLAYVQQAVDVLSRLVQTNAEVTRYRGDLAVNLVRTGTLQITAGDPAAALTSLQRAAELYVTLIDKEPQNAGLRDGQGKCLINLGIAQRKLGQPVEARASLTPAKVIFEDLVKSYPGLQPDLILCYLNLGLAEQAAGDLEAALSWLHRVRELHQQANQQQAVAETLLLIAAVQIQRSEPQVALELYDQARKVAEGIVDPQGPSAELCALLASAWHGRGAVMQSEDQPQEALAAYRQAVDYQRRALDAAKENYAWRKSLSEHYANQALMERETGQATLAIATTLKRRQLWPNDPRELFLVGRDLAAMTPPESNNLSDTEREELSKQAEAAIGILLDAKRAGYVDWEATDKDTAFDGLRNHESFQRLLSDDTF